MIKAGTPYFLIALFLISFLNSCQNIEPGVSGDTIAMWYMLAGTYTKKEGHVDGKGAGIYILSVHPETGALTLLGQSPPLVSPSYFDFHPKKPLVYCVNEHGEGETAQLTALSLDLANAGMRILNSVPSQGHYPCYIEVDPSGSSIMASNYVGGSLISYALKDDGQIGDLGSFVVHSGTGPNEARQEAPHAHMVRVGKDGTSVYAADLGCDQIFHYTLNPASGALQPSGFTRSSEPGSGPRHLEFHPTLYTVYLLNELNGIIDVYSENPRDGVLIAIQSISIVDSPKEGLVSGADIHVHPNGKYLYASNRGVYNEISQFQIDPKTGTLTLIGVISSGGLTPRNFVISPDGAFLFAANQDSSTIQCFKINPETGTLTPLGAPFDLPSPVCLKFVPEYL
ncbi:MAG: lactonase family protein [Saprospiraceae bacterium]|nr:lactonase family protein [Saprospiraceae bacterium]